MAPADALDVATPAKLDRSGFHMNGQFHNRGESQSALSSFHIGLLSAAIKALPERASRPALVHLSLLARCPTDRVGKRERPSRKAKRKQTKRAKRLLSLLCFEACYFATCPVISRLAKKQNKNRTRAEIA